MNTLEFEDNTLPVDFDGSTNIDQLTEVTFGQHLEYPDGSVPMVAKGSGRMSPVRARTMKEYDQQLADLKKENFSLKLRIYFLEERMQQKFGGDEDLFKTAAQQNIELKVEVESLKKELLDKQDLLKKASNALESISSQHQVEIQQTRDDAAKDAATDTRSQVEEMAQRLLEVQNQMEEKEFEFEKTKKLLDDSNGKLQELLLVHRELDAAYKQVYVDKEELQNRLEGSVGSDGLPLSSAQAAPQAIAEKDNVISQLRAAIKTKELIIEQIEEEKNEIMQPLQEKINDMQKELSQKDQQLQFIKLESSGRQTDSGDGHRSKSLESSGIADFKRKVTELEISTEQLTRDLKDKDHMIGKLEDMIRGNERGNKDSNRRNTELERLNRQHEENALKRDKAIQGLTKALQQKDRETQAVSEKLEAREDEMKQMKGQLHQSHMEKYQGIETQQHDLAAKEEKIAELEAAMREKVLEHERLQKSMSRRESEVARLGTQLEKADEVLRQREDAMQDLRDNLQGEKQNSLEKSDTLENHYKALLDDAQRQINNQEKMLQRLSKGLQDKDRQLHGYMDMLQEQEPIHENRESMISGLRQQIHDKDTAIEETVQEKYKAMEEKDNEIRQLKMALRERDHDIERANQMLLTTEETIDALENEAKEKDQTMKQLASALKTQQRAMEENSEGSSRTLQEKEAIIQKLRGSLAKKDKSLQEAIRQSPGATDTMIQHLQQRLQDKENLVQEVMTERSRAADAHEQATNDLLRKLRSKDDEIKDVQTHAKEDINSLNKQIQGLQSELNKKDYDLQTLENRASWAEEQQQEMLDKMRAALNEKDRTIEALVDSGREKDKLFTQLRSRSPDLHETRITGQLAEMQELKDTVSQLRNELQNKDDLVGRLRTAVERRSPKPELIPRQRLADAEAEIAERTENRLQKEMNKHANTESEHIVKLKLEIEHLKEQVDRPGSPQRSQAIGGDGNAQLTQVLRDQMHENAGLSDALQTECDLYQNFNQGHGVKRGGEAFEIELAAVQSLRRQLEEGVEKNSRLRQHLEAQLDGSNRRPGVVGEADVNEVAHLKRELESLQDKLEESLRWNSSLEARLSQQQSQTRPGGVGGAETDSDGRTSLERSLRESSPGYNSSYVPSFQTLPSLDQLIPSDVELSAMKPKQIQAVVKNLRTELEKANTQNEGLEQQITSLRDIPGANEKDRTDGPVSGLVWQKQVHQLERDLRSTEAQNDKLSHQLDAILNGRHSDQDVRIIPVLRQQLSEGNEKLEAAQRELSVLKYATDEDGPSPDVLRSRVKHLENVNDLLKRQIELNTTASGGAGFNPQLIVQMAQEIERLKEELAACSSVKSQSTENLAKKQKKSQIPTFQKFGGPMKATVEAVAGPQKLAEVTELGDTKILNMMLQGKLASTEATVRSQSEKMKYYRGLLEQAGLLPKSPKRSNSESNLSVMSAPDRAHVTPRAYRRRSRSATSAEINKIINRSPNASPTAGLSPTSSLQGLNLAKFTTYGRTLNVKELQEQVAELKVKLANYDNVVRKQKAKLLKSTEELNRPAVDSNGPSKEHLLKEIDSLKSALTAAKGMGVAGDQSTSVKFLRKLIDAHKTDNKDMRTRLGDSENACETLKLRLFELSEFLEELLHQNESGDVDCIDVSPDRVSALKRKLNETRSMLEDLTFNLQAPDDDETEVSRIETGTSNELGDENVSPRSDGSDVQEKLDLAQFRIQELEVQLEATTKDKEDVHREKERFMTEVEKEAQEIQHRNTELLQKNSQLQRLQSDQATKLKSVEKDTQSLRSKLEKLDAERGALKHKVDKLESECHHLQEQLMNERDRASKGASEYVSTQQLLNEEKHAARKIKDLLIESQSNIDEMRMKMERLNGDVDDKNATILKLKKKLKDVQQKQKSDATPRGENGHSFNPFGEDSIERARHQTGSSTASGLPYLSSPPHIIEDSPVSEHGSGKKHRYQNNSGNVADRSPVAADFTKYITKSGERGRVEPEPHPIQTDDLQRLLAPNLHHQLQAVSGDSIFPASSAGEQHAAEIESKYKADIERLRAHIERLQRQLKEEIDMNENLRGELKLYERFNPSASVGVQSSPSVGSHSSQTGNNGQGLGLGDHLSEIRLLRQRLEESVHKNDHLREQLEKQLARAKNADVANIYLGEGSNNDSFSNIQREVETLHRQQQQKDDTIDNLQREVRRLQTDLDKKKEDVHTCRKKLVDLQCLLEQLENKNQILSLEKGAIEIERDNARKDARRLRDEVARLHDQLEENAELNKTLRLELSVMDKVSGDSNKNAPSIGGGDVPNMDLALLMEEIRQLRLQLERTIENNNMLRQKLEEYARGSHGRTDVNIHHLYNNGNGERESDQYMHQYHSYDDDAAYIDHVEKFTSLSGHPPHIVRGSHAHNQLTDLQSRLLSQYNDYSRHTILDSDVPLSRSPLTLRTDHVYRDRAGSANIAPSPPTKLGASPLSPHSRSSHADQLDRLYEMNGFSLHPEDLGAPTTGSRALFGEQYTQKRTAPGLGASELGRAPPSFPGSTENMRYSIYDKNRPPSENGKDPSSPNPESKFPPTEGMVSSRVGSDIRSLYAICAIDDYELLKKEIGESSILLCGMESLLKDRMKQFRSASPSQSLEYNTLRDLSSNLDNLKSLQKEEQRLIALFWISALPQRDEHGNFVDAKMAKENHMLQTEVTRMGRNYSQVKNELKNANERLEAINKKKAEVGRSIIKQLTKTEEVIRRAGNNLEKAQRENLTKH